MGIATIEEDVIFIRPARLYYVGMSEEELYEITRGIWKLAERRELAEYAFAVINFQIMGCYRINSWHQSLETTYSIRTDLEALNDHEKANRYEFLGTSDEKMREKYLDKTVQDYYNPGNANPVMYINC